VSINFLVSLVLTAAGFALFKKRNVA
jgi:hypothetical protein